MLNNHLIKVYISTFLLNSKLLINRNRYIYIYIYLTSTKIPRTASILNGKTLGIYPFIQEFPLKWPLFTIVLSDLANKIKEGK